MIFGHFFYFGHFPFDIPIEAEEIYHHGEELNYRENQMCPETSDAVGTIWEHAQKEFQEFLKIRITLNLLFHKRMICRGKPVQKVDSGNWVLVLQIAQDEKHLNFFCFG